MCFHCQNFSSAGFYIVKSDTDLPSFIRLVRRTTELESLLMVCKSSVSCHHSHMVVPCYLASFGSKPCELKHIFNALQKIFMEIEPKAMTLRVYSLIANLDIRLNTDI